MISHKILLVSVYKVIEVLKSIICIISPLGFGIEYENVFKLKCLLIIDIYHKKQKVCSIFKT